MINFHILIIISILIPILFFMKILNILKLNIILKLINKIFFIFFKIIFIENLHRRLKKIIGQLNAIDRMIDEDVPCENILMQINASKSALHKVGHIIVEGHLNNCVKEAIDEKDSDDALSDLSTILEYYSRF